MKAQRLRVGNILAALVLIVGAICLLILWVIQQAGHAARRPTLAAGPDRPRLPPPHEP